MATADAGLRRPTQDRRPRQLACGLLALGLAGCVGGETPADTRPLDVPPPSKLLPTTLPGYVLGYETPTGASAPGMIDGHTRIFDHQARSPDEAARLVLTAARFQGTGPAHDHVAAYRDEDARREEVDLGDEATLYTRPPDAGRVQTLLVRNATVVWTLQHAPWGDRAPTEDLVGLARGIVGG